MFRVATSHLIHHLRSSSSPSLSGKQESDRSMNEDNPNGYSQDDCRRCAKRQNIIKQANLHRIMSFKQSLFLTLCVFAVAQPAISAAPAPTGPTFLCSGDLADALRRTCGARGTQPVRNFSRRILNPKRFDIVQQCCRNECTMGKLAEFCGKKLIAAEERLAAHLRHVFSRMHFNPERMRPKRSRTQEIQEMNVRTYWSSLAKLHQDTRHDSVLSSMARIRQQQRRVRGH